MRFTVFLLALTVALPSTGAVAATPGHPSCAKIEQACLTRLQRARAVTIAGTGEALPSAKFSDNVCYDNYAAARTTGIWPASFGMPPMGCTND